MLLVRVFCAALFEGFNSLIPLYVRDVLDEDPYLLATSYENVEDARGVWDSRS